MSSGSKICPECGFGLQAGVANCGSCGARVGTVFSEDEVLPQYRDSSLRARKSESAVFYQKVEKAQETANNALALSLASFFCPGIGFIIAGSAIMMGYFSRKTLTAAGTEEGQGPALAAIVISSLGIVAQICYVIYVIRVGMPF